VLPVLLAGAAAATAAGLPGRDQLARVAPAGMARGHRPPAPRLWCSAVRRAPWLRPVASRRLLTPVLLALVFGLVRGPVAGLLAALAGHLALRTSTARTARRSRDLERAAAVEACAALSTELRAGRTPAEALAVAGSTAAGAVADGLREGAAAARLGADVASALTRTADTSAAPELLHGLSACWRVCSESGSGLAAAVDRLAEGLARSHIQRRAVDAELAGPRATAALLAGLPLAGVVLAAGLGARPVHVLLDTPVGAACLAVGISLDLLGVWWTGRIVDAAGARG